MEKKIAVVQFPGSNCEDESIFALKRAGLVPVPFLWNRSIELLRSFDGYFIVGGFSYEDRSRAGVIASLDPVLQSITEEAAKGKAVLGVCNGAQILVESGIFSPSDSGSPSVVLAPNRMERAGKLLGVGYINNYCEIASFNKRGSNAFNRSLEKGESICIPYAHAEGRFIFEDSVEEQFLSEGMIGFQYVDSKGGLDNEYPVNPNGSQHNTAAILNRQGNVMAMMPHPERVEAGDAIFRSIAEYVSEHASGSIELAGRDSLEPEEAVELGRKSLSSDELHLPVKLIITDNTAYSVEDALKRKSFDVEVDRWVIWSVDYAEKISDAVKSELIKSGEILNTNKEFVDELKRDPSIQSEHWLIVDSPVNPLPSMRAETLRNRFDMKALKGLKMQSVWRIKSEHELPPLEDIVRTHIFHHPVTDKIFQLEF